MLESGTVFVSQSEEDDAGEGLFLKRGVNQNDQKLASSFKSQISVLLKVTQGSLVAYYSGQQRLRGEVSLGLLNLFSSQMVRAGMSINEKEEALAYVFGLGNASPKEWQLREVLPWLC